MKKWFHQLSSIPKWYGWACITTYSLVVSVYYSEMKRIILQSNFSSALSEIDSLMLRLSDLTFFLSGYISWILLCFLFHLAVLLLNGLGSFRDLLFSTSLGLLIPTICTIIAILLIGNNDYEGTNDIMAFIETNHKFKLARAFVNYSFVPLYIIVSVIIHYLYNINWYKAILSILLPILAIVLTTFLISKTSLII